MGYVIKALCLLFVLALRAAGGDVAPPSWRGCC